MENNNNNGVTESQQQLTDLIQSLEQATLMAKQLPSTSDTDHHRIIFTSLSLAQLSLHHIFADNSVSSAVDEPMMTADDDGDEEHNSKDSSMDNVEEKLRDSLYIQNKRPKRPISPSSAIAIERRRFEDGECVRVPTNFDSSVNRLKSFDLVYQFHA